MKSLLLISALSLMSFSTFAACDASILDTTGAPSKPFQAELSEILTNKGYNVIEDSKGAATSDVGRLILQVSTLYYTSNNGCTLFSDKRVECGASVMVSKVASEGVLEYSGNINLSDYSKGSLFKSQAKIAAAFKANFLTLAAASIPECK